MAGKPGGPGARKHFPLRLSPELYEALERWAADELRSVNAQIEFLLTDAARRGGKLRPRPAAHLSDPAAPPEAESGTTES